MNTTTTNETTPAQRQLGEGQSGIHKAAGSTAESTTSQQCATCPRHYDPDQHGGRLAARLWINRPDGAGLMCPRCQRLVRRGQL